MQPTELSGYVRVSAAHMGNRFVGTATDNRMLPAIMNILTHPVNTTQTLSHRQHINLALVLDAGIVGDTTTTSSKEYSNAPGKGPTLVHKDTGTHYRKELIWQMVDVAEHNGIPWRLQQLQLRWICAYGSCDN